MQWATTITFIMCCLLVVAVFQLHTELETKQQQINRLHQRINYCEMLVNFCVSDSDIAWVKVNNLSDRVSALERRPMIAQLKGK
jgi:hypothetical protein